MWSYKEEDDHTACAQLEEVWADGPGLLVFGLKGEAEARIYGCVLEAWSGRFSESAHQEKWGPAGKALSLDGIRQEFEPRDRDCSFG